MENYEKQTWVDGVTPINAERLGHMEDGIEASSKQIENEFDGAGIDVTNYASVDVNVSGGGDDIKEFIETHGTITSFANSTVSVVGQGAFAYCYLLTYVLQRMRTLDSFQRDGKRWWV